MNQHGLSGTSERVLHVETLTRLDVCRVSNLLEAYLPPWDSVLEKVWFWNTTFSLSVARPMSVLPIREMTGPMDANLGVDGSKNHLSKDTKVQQKCAKDQCREGSFSTSGVTDDSSQVMSRKSGFELDPCDTIPIQRKGQPWLGFWGIHRRLVLFWCCHSDRLGHKATR